MQPNMQYLPPRPIPTIMPKILAFGHQKGVGKDQFVKFCFDVLKRSRIGKMKLVRRGFADKLYDICYSVYGWAGFQTRTFYVQNPDQKKAMLATGKTVRETLIELGNHLRAYDPDLWINANLRDAGHDILFVNDIRYPNEFLQVKAVAGNATICVKITRPGLPEPTDVADCALNGWKHWDVEIVNDGDLNDLYLKAEQFVSDHFPGV